MEQLWGEYNVRSTYAIDTACPHQHNGHRSTRLLVTRLLYIYTLRLWASGFFRDSNKLNGVRRDMTFNRFSLICPGICIYQSTGTNIPCIPPVILYIPSILVPSIPRLIHYLFVERKGHFFFDPPDCPGNTWYRPGLERVQWLSVIIGNVPVPSTWLLMHRCPVSKSNPFWIEMGKERSCSSWSG